jgi:hypothetical protein
MMMPLTKASPTRACVFDDRCRRSAWWLVALVHRNMYSSSVSQGSILQLRHELEPLFNKHGVDLVVHGHDHN